MAHTVTWIFFKQLVNQSSRLGSGPAAVVRSGSQTPSQKGLASNSIKHRIYEKYNISLNFSPISSIQISMCPSDVNLYKYKILFRPLSFTMHSVCQMTADTQT